MKKSYFMVVVAMIFMLQADIPYAIGGSTYDYTISGTPFTMTVEKTVESGGVDGEVHTTYQYYLNINPQSSHSGVQRVEYVGFRIVYSNKVQYYQIFENGSVIELTSPDQVLYNPSRYAEDTNSVGRFQISGPTSIDLQGVLGTACLNDYGMVGSVSTQNAQEVNIYAGYGFLTQENTELIDRLEELQNSSIIQQQGSTQALDIETMQLAIAQGNMFSFDCYYPILNLVACQEEGADR